MAEFEEEKKKAKSEFSAKVLADKALAQYEIKGSEDDWKAALSGGKTPAIISVKGSVIGQCPFKCTSSGLVIVHLLHTLRHLRIDCA